MKAPFEYFAQYRNSKGQFISGPKLPPQKRFSHRFKGRWSGRLFTWLQNRLTTRKDIDTIKAIRYTSDQRQADMLHLLQLSMLKAIEEANNNNISLIEYLDYENFITDRYNQPIERDNKK